MSESTIVSQYISPLGEMTMASDGEALTGLWFDGQKYFGGNILKKGVEYEGKSLPVFEDTRRWLNLYFQGENPDFLPQISFGNATEFRREVWEILLEIPYGKLITYGEIADKIARKKGLVTMSAQAVGGAVGHNPISVLVPCHRVIGSDGSLTGYAGGLERKLALLNIEQRNYNE